MIDECPNYLEVSEYHMQEIIIRALRNQLNEDLFNKVNEDDILSLRLTLDFAESKSFTEFVNMSWMIEEKDLK